jgi:hypothetical protein
MFTFICGRTRRKEGNTESKSKKEMSIKKEILQVMICTN